jgi:hypothetical protein
MPDKPTLDKFLKDPAYQSDRELFEGLIENFLQRKATEAEAKRIEEEKKKPKTFWDDFFQR